MGRGRRIQPLANSCRRKYRKMRVKFEDTMNTSNTLIRDEFRAIAVARRLQEQNECVSGPPRACTP